MDNFRQTFYNGEQDDPECAKIVKPTRGAPATRGRGGAAAARGRGTRANASSSGLKDRKIIDCGSSDAGSVKSGAGRGRGKVRQMNDLNQIPEDDGEDEVKISNGP